MSSHRQRLGAGFLTLFLALSLPAATGGLTCVQHRNVEEAALEALRGDDPRWGHEYVVARVDSVEGGQLAPLTLTVTPTHVFSGDHGRRIRLAARSDGPPDPGSWTVGGLYFLVLDESSAVAGVEALVAPCAPNFRVTTAEQLDRLVRGAPTVEVRDPAVTLASSFDVLGSTWLLVGAAGVVGMSTWLAFRRRHRHPGQG